MPIMAFSLYGFSEPKAVVHAFSALATHNSSAYFLCGILIELVWLRLYGMGFLWRSALGESYLVVVKNAAEEPTLTLGYLLCIGGLIFITRNPVTRNPYTLPD